MANTQVEVVKQKPWHANTVETALKKRYGDPLEKYLYPAVKKRKISLRDI